MSEKLWRLYYWVLMTWHEAWCNEGHCVGGDFGSGKKPDGTAYAIHYPCGKVWRAP